MRVARRLRALDTVRPTPFCSNVLRPPRANGERVASRRSRVPSRSDPTRARVATEGFGARLLELQDADGQWASGAFFLAGHDFHAEGQPWTATMWALNTLREWGLDPKALNDTAQWLAENCRWEYDNLPYWDGEVDCCINSWTVANGLWLGRLGRRFARPSTRSRDCWPTRKQPVARRSHGPRTGRLRSTCSSVTCTRSFRPVNP